MQAAASWMIESIQVSVVKVGNTSIACCTVQRPDILIRLSGDPHHPRDNAGDLVCSGAEGNCSHEDLFLRADVDLRGEVYALYCRSAEFTWDERREAYLFAQWQSVPRNLLIDGGLVNRFDGGIERLGELPVTLIRR